MRPEPRNQIVGDDPNTIPSIPGQPRPEISFKPANDGHDTRAIQHYLGHKNIQCTTLYTQLAPDRFNDFWTD